MTINESYFKKLEKTYGRLSFGEMLRALREAEGESQAQFAQSLGFSVQNLCDLEKGRRIPSPKRAASIAQKLKLPEKSMIAFALRDALQADGFDYDIILK